MGLKRYVDLIIIGIDDALEYQYVPENMVAIMD